MFWVALRFLLSHFTRSNCSFIYLVKKKKNSNEENNINKKFGLAETALGQKMNVCFTKELEKARIFYQSNFFKERRVGFEPTALQHASFQD